MRFQGRGLLRLSSSCGFWRAECRRQSAMAQAFQGFHGFSRLAAGMALMGAFIHAGERAIINVLMIIAHFTHNKSFNSNEVYLLQYSIYCFCTK
jgi:hypothetical protein